MERGEGNFITVTHFINPQLFWYQKLDVRNDNFQLITQLEQKLTGQYISCTKFPTKFVPNVGDIIAVHFLAWKKFIRAEVLHIIRDDEYIVWALDYGFPFTTKRSHVRRLDASNARPVDHVRRGGLAGILPAELDFDFTESRPVMMTKDHWSQRACDSLEKLLTDAASVTFVERFPQRQGEKNVFHFWGDLEIVNHKGNKFQASEYLIAINCGKEAGPKFGQICGSLLTTRIKPWLSNRGNTKVKDNAFKAVHLERVSSNSARPEFCDEFAKRKVEDWCARNTRAADDAPMDMFESPTTTIDDISFDDSVSVKYQLLSGSTMNTKSDRRMGMHMADILTKSSKAIKSDMEKLPQSSVIPLEEKSPKDVKAIFNNSAGEASYSKYLSEDALYALDRERDFYPPLTNQAADVPDTTPPKSTATASTCSGPSRKQKLLEIRKKVANNQSPEASQTTSTIESTSNSAINYKLLQESTLDSSEARELQLITKMNDISVAEETSGSMSVGSSRANQLREICRKYAAQDVPIVTSEKESEETNVQKTSKHRDNLRKLREQQAQTCGIEHSKHNETESVVSAASSRASRLVNIRKKIKEQHDSDLTTRAQSDSFFEKNSAELSEITEKQNYEFPDFTATNKNKYKESMLNDLDKRKVVPAGFDLTNLYHYKDEQNHWHRKKTTRYDKVPHDNVSSAGKCLLNTTKNSYSSSLGVGDMSYESLTDDGTKPSLSVIKSGNKRTNAQSNQYFRHTRSHTDKYKGEQVCSEEHLLDATVPDLDSSILRPCIENTTEDTKQSTRSTEEMENRSPQTDEITIDNGINGEINNVAISSIIDNVNPKRGKRRELKSPTLQKDKLDAILRCAKFQKELGNSNILDLNNLNVSGGSSRTETESFEDANSVDDGNAGGSDSDTKSSNKRALVENRLLKQEKAAKEDKITPFMAPNQTDQLSQKPITLIYSAESSQWTEVEGERCLQSKLMDNLVLAHSKVAVHVSEKLSDVYLLQEIHDEMVNMRVTKVFRIQAYGWSHVLRGNSLFVVNPSRSGKTWCYLPPICSLVCYRTRSNMLPDSYGPVAIILVPSSKHVEHVNKYCRRLLTSFKGKVTAVPSFGLRNMIETKIQLLNGCGILVVTPANLVRLLHDNAHECLIDPARLLHLVVDDMDLMLSRSQEDFETALKTLYKLRKKSSNAEPLHVVVTSRDWDARMVPMMCRANQPLLLIGDFLEAAVYGKAIISIKLRSSEQKIATIMRFIEKHPLHMSRLLIFCNNGPDVDQVAQALTAAGFVCIGYNNSSNAVMRLIIEEWKQIFSSQVLICSDDAFPELQIQNVKNIIHYSMPTSWTKFTARFSAMAQTYENFVSKDFTADLCTNADEVKAHSLILLDEENSMQLPRLFDFMKNHNQLKYIHSDIMAVMKRVLLQREEARILKDTALCPYVLEFGDCDESHCYYRHNLTQFDAVTKTEDIPTCGDLRIHILEVFSPTHYSARLLQHKPPNSKQWHEVRRSNKAALFAMQLNLHYMQGDNLVQHWPLQLNDLCVCKVQDNFQRVRIVDMPEMKYTDIVQKVKLSVKLIDMGGNRPVDSDEVFILDSKFKEFPEQALDIRLMGVVPFDNERTWDSKATKAVNKWIMGDIGKNDCVHVSIHFALAHNIWVKNVIVMEQLPTVGQYVYRVNLKRSLLERDFALLSNKKDHAVRNLAEEIGLLHVDAEDDDAITEVEYESCYNDSSNLIKFSSNGDDTFDGALLKTKADRIDGDSISKESNNLQQPQKTLSEDDQENWDTSCESERANEIYLPLSSNKYNENAPESMPHHKYSATCADATEQWCQLPLHNVVKVEIGDEDENGKWADIYMQIIDEEHMRKCEALLQLINQYIAKITELPEKSSKDICLQPINNVIVKYDGLYLRAKLVAIFGEANEERIYRFFLCDYACFVTVKAAELYNDFLYETTKEIVEFTPYQAVHCTLAGIKLDRFAKRHLITKDYLFAYAVNKCAASPPSARCLTINSFEILLYECDKEYDFSSAVMFNKTLVEHAVAVMNENTKYYLDFDAGVDLIGNVCEAQNNDLASFEELLHCIEKSFELDAAETITDDERDGKNVRKKLCEIKAICSVTGEKVKEERQIKLKKLAKTIAEENQIQHCADMNPESENLSPVLGSNNQTVRVVPNQKIKKKEKPSTYKVEHADQNLQNTAQNCATNSTELALSNSPVTPLVPPLTALHKRPQTTWYETDYLIFLSIHAPDIDDYYLNVTQDTLIFAAYIRGEEHALVLNFLGTVRPECVSHEVRGLNVVVRLVKSIYMKWPRLLRQPNKFPWLTYDLNAIDTHEMEHLLPQQRLLMAMDTAQITHNCYDSDTTDDSDNEKNLFQTYTPIFNSEDVHDPTSELL